MKFITPNSVPPDHGKKYGTVNTEESLCQASDARDMDINILMARFGATGQLPATMGNALFGDFSEVKDYRSAIDAIREAEEAFLDIPAKVRDEFRNDPQAFMEFVGKPENIPKLREWGLAKPAPEAPKDEANG